MNQNPTTMNKMNYIVRKTEDSVLLKSILTGYPAFVVAGVLFSAIMEFRIVYPFFIILYILNSLTNKVFKNVIFKPSMGTEATRRPSGMGGTVGRTDTPYGCGLFASGKISKTSGFPSGHSQFAAMAATFWILYVLRQYRKEGKWRHHGAKEYICMALKILPFVVMALLVMTQRVQSRCHSITQVVVGAAFGIVIGVFGFKVYQHTMEYKTRKV